MSKTEINLPKTAFSMKANLPVREPEILELWNKINLYQELRKNRTSKQQNLKNSKPWKDEIPKMGKLKDSKNTAKRSRSFSKLRFVW